MRRCPLREFSFGMLLAIALAACAAHPAAAPAARVATPGAVTGRLEGAAYRIEIPEAWNGDLIMYLHGYDAKGDPPPEEIGPNDFTGRLLAKGYAVAQSGYSTQGWAVAEALVDNERLRQHVVALYGQPRHTLMIGHSMGGHLVLATLEGHPDAYDGALDLCGANMPAAELFADGVIAPLIAFDYFYPGALGLAPGGLADPASPAQQDTAALETALHGNEARADTLARRFRIPRSDLAGALMFRYLILREMMQRAGGSPVDNHGTSYVGFGDDAAFNAGVRRYTGDPAALAYVRDNAPLAGTTRKPVVMLSNRVDPLVTPLISSRYAALAAAAGNSAQVLVLPSVGEGHCAFGPEAVDRAFDTLAAWVNSGRRPPAP